MFHKSLGYILSLGQLKITIRNIMFFVLFVVMLGIGWVGGEWNGGKGPKQPFPERQADGRKSLRKTASDSTDNTRQKNWGI